MKITKKVIDINAHVQNITCQLSAGSDNSVANIGFDNLGFGTISAIKFNAKGYNSFGDVVQINGKEKFFLIIQDISVAANESERNLKAVLPSPDIRKLDLEEAQICFTDGTVVSYDGKDQREFELEEYENTGTDKEIFEALKYKFGSTFKYQPKEYAEGWICGCGRFNKKEDISCSCCKNLKTDMFKYTTVEVREKLIEHYRKAEEKRAEATRQEIKRKEKEATKKKIYIGIGSVIAVILLFFIIHAAILSGRTTYDSEEAMRDDVTGTYTYYDAMGKADRQLVITDDEVSMVWSGIDESLESDVREWNYKNGTFRTFETYTVLSNGDIKDDDGDVYERGGYMSSSSYSYSYESGATALKIQDVKVSNNGSYTICTGSVKNTGSKTYKFIEVKGAFKDSNGNVIDTDWTYAAGSEGLAPDESTTFRLSVDKDYKIESCSVSLLDYD